MQIKAWKWIAISLLIGVSLEWYDAHSTREVNSVNEIQFLSLPARAIFEGIAKNIHFSGTALVFEIENNGKITCYWRHSPKNFTLLSKDRIRVTARIETTPNGNLCIVEEVHFIASS